MHHVRTEGAETLPTVMLRGLTERSPLYASTHRNAMRVRYQGMKETIGSVLVLSSTRDA